MIGGSQMGRIAGEMQRIGGELVGVHKMYKVTGEWTEEEGGEGKEWDVGGGLCPRQDCDWRPGELHYKARVAKPVWFWTTEKDCIPVGGKRRGEDKAGVPSHRASENKYAGEE